MQPKKLKILCAAMDSQGHVNAVLGFAKVLKQRGHHVIITFTPAWKSLVEKHGFEFIPLVSELVSEDGKENRSKKLDESNGQFNGYSNGHFNGKLNGENGFGTTNGDIEDKSVKNEMGESKTFTKSKVENGKMDDKTLKEARKSEPVGNSTEIHATNGYNGHSIANNETEKSEPAAESKVVNGENGKFDDLKVEKETQKPETGGKDGVNLIAKLCAKFRLSPLDQVKDEDDESQFYIPWYDKMFSLDKALKKVIDMVSPDMILIDILSKMPCLEKGSIPWAQLWSSNPTMVYHGHCPPATTGFPTDSPRELWDEYFAYRAIKFEKINAHVNSWLISHGLEPYGKYEHTMVGPSKWINFYTYPEFLDYTDVAPKLSKWVRIDSSVREPDDPTPFELPENLKNKPGALIYFSLGTIGSIDLELMKRVIGACAKSPHRFIVSKGPNHEKIDLPDNMWGDRYINQIAILPHCDIVITHGGNNTLTESIHFGKPMIVMPVFFDQLDNAQRIVEKGLGIRIDTYHFKDEQLHEAIETILADSTLKEKLSALSAKLKSSTIKSMENACQLIETTVSLGRSPFDEPSKKTNPQNKN